MQYQLTTFKSENVLVVLMAYGKQVKVNVHGTLKPMNQRIKGDPYRKGMNTMPLDAQYTK